MPVPNGPAAEEKPNRLRLRAALQEAAAVIISKRSNSDRSKETGGYRGAWSPQITAGRRRRAAAGVGAP
jgi:hypothetical protein